MKREIADKWIAALRSGEYKQGVGFLRDGETISPTTYCCLGVLTDLYVREASNYSHDCWGDNKNLSEEVIEWAGCGSSSGDLPDEHDERLSSLSNLNDDGLSFGEIADLIERRWADI